MSELTNPEFWVGVGFCLMVVFLSYPVGKKIKQWAVSQANAVKKELDEAHNLRCEAEALYQKYETHTKNLEHERAEIMHQAEKEVFALQREADERLSKKIERKKQDVQARINLIQSNTRKDLTGVMMDQVLEKTKIRLSEKNIRQTPQDMDKALDDVLCILEKAVSK